MRIAVIGAGAIGGITAAFMAQAGQDITLVCKHPAIAEQARSHGLRIEGVRGAHNVPVQAVVTVQELSGVYDACLIATKAYDLEQAARDMLPYLCDDSLVVSMQNGICVDALAAVVGQRRTVGCVIGWGATMKGPASLEMTSNGEFVLGMAGGDCPPKLSALQKAMSSVTPCEISPNIYAHLYSKLIVNACITSLGAICGLRLGEMMKRADARNIFLAIIQEAMDVAHGMNLSVPPFGGKLDYDRLMAGRGALSRLRRHGMIRLVGLKFRRLKSSSLQSLERGKPTEIDYFNGYIAAKGRETGVATPVNDALTAMVKSIERGELSISTKNLSAPAFHALRY